MILTFSQWRNVIIINTPTTTESKSITILTFNTRLFNNQSKNGFDEITKFIKENNADIVCLQEFGHYYNFGKSKKDILNFFDSIYPYRHIWFKNQNTLGENGLATFSRYPIIEKKKIEYKSDDNISIYSDIVINSDTIRVINNHLESNKLNQEDRNLAQKIINKENSQDKIYNIGLNASSKFISSAQNRIQQVEAVRTIINNTKYPIIVLGDFNDVPLSYTYHTIAKGLQNAQAKAGEWGYHWTYNKNAMFFTIDHILIDKNIQITDCTIHKEIKASDHYPISCKIQL